MESDGFTIAERAAMKERSAELRADGKKGAKQADVLQAVLDKIAEMAPEDRALAERVHATVTTVAPELSPRTWYGMPAYANTDGKIIIYFQDAGKFKARYATLGFHDEAYLDDGDLWPVSYAVQRWSPTVEKRVADLVQSAASVAPPDPRVRLSGNDPERFAGRDAWGDQVLPVVSGVSGGDMTSGVARLGQRRFDELCCLDEVFAEVGAGDVFPG